MLKSTLPEITLKRKITQSPTRMIDFSKIIGYSDSRYPALDPTTPHYEFNSYVECCRSLNVPNQPSVGRFMKYRNYLKEIKLL